MKRIYKYRLLLTDTQSIYLSVGAKILTVQDQNGELCLWAEVYPKASRTELRTFHIVGTGNPLPEGSLVYIATVQQDGFVWHIYEEVCLKF